MISLVVTKGEPVASAVVSCGGQEIGLRVRICDFAFSQFERTLQPQPRKENAMKIILATLSALGLMTSAALADCAGHPKVTASTSVDYSTTTASVASDDQTLVASKKRPVEEQSVATE